MYPLLLISIINTGLAIHLYSVMVPILRKIVSGGSIPELSEIISGNLSGKEVQDDLLIHEKNKNAWDLFLFSIENKLNWISNFAGLSTMLGLLGTVLGIFDAFQRMKESGHASVEIFAGGISEALITTIFGLSIAIPSIIIYHFLRMKLDEIDILSDNLNEVREMKSVR